jgi:ketosteroid isomerase-like protein
VTNADLIQEFFRRFNAEDVDGLLELFTDDCSFSMILYDRDIQGKAELRAFVELHLANWSEHREWPTSIIVEGDAGASELHFEGVTTAGSRVVMDNLNVWDFVDGRIRRIRVYADTAPMREAFA